MNRRDLLRSAVAVPALSLFGELPNHIPDERILWLIKKGTWEDVLPGDYDLLATRTRKCIAPRVEFFFTTSERDDKRLITTYTQMFRDKKLDEIKRTMAGTFLYGMASEALTGVSVVRTSIGLRELTRMLGKPLSDWAVLTLNMNGQSRHLQRVSACGTKEPHPEGSRCGCEWICEATIWAR